MNRFTDSIKITSKQKLLIIILLALLLRLIHISDTPPALNWDEVSHGYNAYSILKTGKDEWGVTFPSIFRAYGDYKLPVYIYTSALSVAIFGLNTFAVRFPSVLAGVAIVVFTYFLTLELFVKQKNRKPSAEGQKLAIIASLLIAIEPWSLFLSRGAFEANLAQAFIVAGAYFFLKGLSKHIHYMLLSATLIGLSVWTYNSARIFVPIFLLFVIWLYRKRIALLWKKNTKPISYSLLLIAFFFIPMFWQLLSPLGQARYGWVSIIDEGAIAQINEARGSSSLSTGLSRLVHNKGTFFISKFARNYASHYSPNFLFLKGGSDYQFSVPGYGLVYPINAILLIIGVVISLKVVVRWKHDRRWRERRLGLSLVLGWFFLGPVASSLTREVPHALRTITIIPIPMIFVAVGSMHVLGWIKGKSGEIPIKKIALIIYLILLIASLENYLNIYFKNYRNEYSWSWQYGYEQVVDYTKSNYSNYDKVIVSKKYGEPHEFFLFFWPWEPAKYQNDPDLIRFHQSNWYWVDRFDKFYFVNHWQINEEGTDNNEFWLESRERVVCGIPGITDEELKLIEIESTDKCLLVTNPGNVPNGWIKLKTINFLDGDPAFEIYEN